MIVVNKSLFDKMAEQYNLEKALGHKYIKRVPKKSGKGYIYYYSDGHGGLVAGKPPKNETPKKGGENTADFGVKVGDKVSFESKGKMLEGIVRGGDKDSIIIDGIGEGKGVRYTVPGNQVKEKTGNADGTIPAKVFSAADYKKQFTDPLATNDENGIKHILDSFGAEGREIAEKAAETEKRVKESKQSIDQYRLEGEGVFAKYTPERERLHNQIIASFFEPDKIHSAKPPKGEKPTFVMFGGRGGSGKSWFTDKERAKAAGVDVMFDSDKYIIIDADAIKEKLKPPYEGWNAGVVHEESSDISKMVIDMAKKLGLNIILDGTMSNPKKAVKQMQDFKNLGYRTEAHYMFLPVQESTKRAIGRFKTKNNDYSGRFVPLKNLVGMTDNELAFDEVKNIVDDWSFRSNYNVERGKPPVLVSKKE